MYYITKENNAGFPIKTWDVKEQLSLTILFIKFLLTVNLNTEINVDLVSLTFSWLKVLVYCFQNYATLLNCRF